MASLADRHIHLPMYFPNYRYGFGFHSKTSNSPHVHKKIKGLIQRLRERTLFEQKLITI